MTPAYYLVLVATAIVAVELFSRAGLVEVGQRLARVAPLAASTMRATDIDDDEKERTVRRLTLETLRDTVQIALRFALVFAGCALVMLGGAWLLGLSVPVLVDATASWQGIVGLTVAAVAWAMLTSRVARGRGREAAGERTGEGSRGPVKNAYGRLDRLLHRVAFAHPSIQKILGDVENDMFRSRLADRRVDRPVFVTGLPRAGTTLVLELLYRSGGFASFTYRHMPFVLAPMLWDRLSAGSRKGATSVERAHGDGMEISYDSPEAFEEVLWLSRLRGRIVADGHLAPLGAGDIDDDFREAFERLVRKLVTLAADDPEAMPRYLSKNNANVARLAALPAIFPDAVVLCCFRDPATQAVSLDTQHRNFLEMHARDAFARRYMAWIGHHDFGANFLPIDVGDIARTAPAADALDLEFWLRYWVAVYRHALDTAPATTRFLDYDAMRSGGADGLVRLARHTGLDGGASERLVAQAGTLREPGSAPAAFEGLPESLVAEAAALHARLVARAATE